MARCGLSWRVESCRGGAWLGEAGQGTDGGRRSRPPSRSRRTMNRRKSEHDLPWRGNAAHGRQCIARLVLVRFGESRTDGGRATPGPCRGPQKDFRRNRQSGRTRHGEARRSTAVWGRAWRGDARPVKHWLGWARKRRRSAARPGLRRGPKDFDHTARFGIAWIGSARHRRVGCGNAGLGRATARTDRGGFARPGRGPGGFG